jgi:hypothetical protein
VVELEEDRKLTGVLVCFNRVESVGKSKFSLKIDFGGAFELFEYRKAAATKIESLLGSRGGKLLDV